MKVPLAWRNTFDNPRRMLTAVSGIAFAVTLIFMQLGFRESLRTTVAMLYDSFDFDVALVSSDYQSLIVPGTLHRTRLAQAAVNPSIDSSFPLNLRRGVWTRLEPKGHSQVLLVGIDMDPAFIRNREIREQLSSLEGTDTLMLDRLSHRDFGPRQPGIRAELNGVKVRVSSLCSLGMGFFTEGTAIMKNSRFYDLAQGDPGEISLGLLKVKTGADVDAVVAALRASLPSDVLVFRHKDLVAREQSYFVSTKPTGVLFQAGVLVAFLVGAVVLFQVLSSEIANRFREYATLRAMGYPDTYVYGVGFSQAMLYTITSFVPASLISWGVYAMARAVSHLPVQMSPGIALTVFGITALMCTLSGVLALWKVRLSDPADLF